jgi:hypothetical protein
MPFVSGFLRIRRPGRHPDQGLPGPEGPVDPDYGVDEGELPEVEPPDPPVGVWPPLTPENPWRPIDPGWGVGRPERPSTGPVPTPPVQPGQPLPRPPIGGGGHPDQGLPGEGGEAGHLPAFPPGAMWPPLPPGVHGKYLALVLVAGMPGVKYRYVVIDADASFPKPEPKPPEAQPKA